MIRAHSIAFLGALLPLVAAGCGEPDVTGGWSGRWDLDNSIFAGDLGLDLTQDGHSVEGSSDIGGTLCALGGHVDGAVDDHRFSFTIDNGSGRIELEGTINVAQDRIDGKFDVVDGACSGSHGTFHVER